MSSRRTFVQKALTVVATCGLLPGFLPGDMQIVAKKTEGWTGEQDDLQKINELITGKAPIKWIFAGDSITQGAKHTSGLRSYPEIFAERIRWEMGRVRDVVINTAISGNTSKDIVSDFEWRIAQFKPTIVSVMIGTNDASEKKSITKEAFRQNNLELINRIRGLGAIPILQTPNIIITERATGRERIQDYIVISRQIAADNQVILVDHFAFWSEKVQTGSRERIFTKWLNDELHPNAAGHVQMAHLLFRKLSLFDPNAFTCRES